MTELLYLLSLALKTLEELSFVDVFENRNEIWFNWNNGKTYKLIWLAVE